MADNFPYFKLETGSVAAIGFLLLADGRNWHISTNSFDLQQKLSPPIGSAEWQPTTSYLQLATHRNGKPHILA
jgi:hypothetical protein